MENAVPEKNPDLESAEIRDNVEDHNAGFEFQPLFGDGAPDEAALKGDDTAEETAGAEPKVETKEDEKDAKDLGADDGKKDEKEDAEKAESKEGTKEEPKDEADKKPPPGFVPREALHQERQTTKNLKAENARLAAELEKAQSAYEESDESDDEFKDFEVLDSKAFDDLLEDDPDAATKYQYKLTRFLEYQRETQRLQQAKQRSEQAEREIIQTAVEEMERVLPGCTQKEPPEEVGVLGDFAIEQGIAPGMLAIITNPTTKITTRNGENYYMGQGAAQIIKLIKSFHESRSNQPDAAKIRAEVESELRPKIEAEVQEKLMKKFQSGAEGFRSLDDVAGSGKKETAPLNTGTLTETDWAKLSPQEQAQLLGA